MDPNTKIDVRSMISGEVSVNLPEIGLRRSWARKGAVQKIPFEALEQALYTPGVEAMFAEGVLYIENMEHKIALGLEPDDAKEPVNIIVLSEAQMKRYLTVAPVHELKAALQKISRQQATELAEMAITLKIADLDKADLLKERTGLNVMKIILLLKEAEEAEKRIEQ